MIAPAGQGPSLRERWDRLWFAPGDPRNLAAARILVAVHAMWMVLSRETPLLSGVPREFWRSTAAQSATRFLLFPGAVGLERGVEVLALAALLSVALGVATRYAAPAAALMLYHLAPLQTLAATPNPINRGLTIAVLALVVLGASRCADSWTIRPRRAREESQPWEYGWPLRLIWLFVAEIYLLGFVGKLRETGLGWFTAENIRRNVTLFGHMHPEAPVGVADAIAGRPALLWIGAAGVLVLEGGFILCLFSARARRVLVPVAIAMHVAIWRMMGIVFANVAHLAVFVDWGDVADRLARSSREAKGVPRLPERGARAS